VGTLWIVYTEGRAQHLAFPAAELFGETFTSDPLVTYLRIQLHSSKDKDDTYQMFHSIRQSWNGQVLKLSIIATDLLMHRSRLPEDSLSDQAFVHNSLQALTADSGKTWKLSTREKRITTLLFISQKD